MTCIGQNSNRGTHGHLRDEDCMIFDFLRWDHKFLFFKGRKDKEIYLYGGFPNVIIAPYGTYLRFGWRMYWLGDRDDTEGLHEHHDLSTSEEVAPESNNRVPALISDSEKKRIDDVQQLKKVFS